MEGAGRAAFGATLVGHQPMPANRSELCCSACSQARDFRFAASQDEPTI